MAECYGECENSLTLVWGDICRCSDSSMGIASVHKGIIEAF